MSLSRRTPGSSQPTTIHPSSRGPKINFHTGYISELIADNFAEHGEAYLVEDENRIPEYVFRTGMDMSEEHKEILKTECNKFKYDWGDYFKSRHPVLAQNEADRLVMEIDATEMEIDGMERQLENQMRLDGDFEENGPLGDTGKSGSGRVLAHLNLLHLAAEMTGVAVGENSEFSSRFGHEVVVLKGVRSLYGRNSAAVYGLHHREELPPRTFAYKLPELYQEAIFLHNSPSALEGLLPEQAYLHFTKYLRKLGILHNIIRKNSNSILSERRAKHDGSAYDQHAKHAEVAGEVLAFATTPGGYLMKAGTYVAGKLGDAAADTLEVALARNPPPEPEPRIRPSALHDAAPLPEEFVLLNLKEIPLVHVFLRTELASAELTKDEESFLDEDWGETLLKKGALFGLRHINAVPQMYGNAMKDFSYDLMSGQGVKKLQRFGKNVNKFLNKLKDTDPGERGKTEAEKQKEIEADMLAEEDEVGAGGRGGRIGLVVCVLRNCFLYVDSRRF